MTIVVTGAEGFIGKNLCAFLKARGYADVIGLDRHDTDVSWQKAVEKAEFIFHLAVVNRPKNEEDFIKGNVDLTDRLCSMFEGKGSVVPILYTSSIQATRDVPYGRSKRLAEDRLRAYGKKTGAKVFIFRLPNVFGQGCRPDYNSAVATFCYNTVHALPITVHDPDAALSLVFVGDVVQAFGRVLGGGVTSQGFCDVQPVYETTVGAVVKQIKLFKSGAEPAEDDLARKLYATYLSYRTDGVSDDS